MPLQLNTDVLYTSNGKIREHEKNAINNAQRSVGT